MIAIQYIAGLLDGEGSLSVLRNQRTNHSGVKNGKLGYSPAICIANQNKEVLDLTRDFFNFGKVYGPREGNLGYDFQIRNLSDSITFLKIILPFLIIKKQKAEDLLAICELRLREIESQGYNVEYSADFLAMVKKYRGDASSP